MVYNGKHSSKWTQATVMYKVPKPIAKSNVTDVF